MDYDKFEELPNHIKAWLRDTGQPNVEKWVEGPIPALGNRSILQVASDSDGEKRLAEFCLRLKASFA